MLVAFLALSSRRAGVHHHQGRLHAPPCRLQPPNAQAPLHTFTTGTGSCGQKEFDQQAAPGRHETAAPEMHTAGAAWLPLVRVLQGLVLMFVAVEEEHRISTAIGRGVVIDDSFGNAPLLGVQPGAPCGGAAAGGPGIRPGNRAASLIGVAHLTSLSWQLQAMRGQCLPGACG
jgi:hypothetical protein